MAQPRADAVALAPVKIIECLQNAYNGGRPPALQPLKRACGVINAQPHGGIGTGHITNALLHRVGRLIDQHGQRARGHQARQIGHALGRKTQGLQQGLALRQRLRAGARGGGKGQCTACAPMPVVDQDLRTQGGCRTPVGLAQLQIARLQTGPIAAGQQLHQNPRGAQHGLPPGHARRMLCLLMKLHLARQIICLHRRKWGKAGGNRACRVVVNAAPRLAPQHAAVYQRALHQRGRVTLIKEVGRIYRLGDGEIGVVAYQIHKLARPHEKTDGAHAGV